MNKLYKYAGKFNNQQQYKAITESATVSTNEEINSNGPMDVTT